MKLCVFVSGRKYQTYVMLKTKIVFALFDRLLTLKIQGFTHKITVQRLRCFVILYLVYSKRSWLFLTVKMKNRKLRSHFSSGALNGSIFIWFDSRKLTTETIIFNVYMHFISAIQSRFSRHKFLRTLFRFLSAHKSILIENVILRYAVKSEIFISLRHYLTKNVLIFYRNIAQKRTIVSSK